MDFLPGLAWNHDPPNLCLLSRRQITGANHCAWLLPVISLVGLYPRENSVHMLKEIHIYIYTMNIHA
jgi:hypothetical protein